jgi:Ca2+-binding RTX toxin-like protein
MSAINGTIGADQLIGTSGDDVVSGFDGGDSIAGGSGSDTLNGGLGDDLLTDGDGNDVLSGGAGADNLQADHSGTGGPVAAQSISLDGGDGADTLAARADALHPLLATLTGGAGDDFIFTAGNLSLVVDAGDGNDLVQITAQQNGATTVTLGVGTDVLAYEPDAGWTAPVVVTDFQAGDAGDRLAARLDLLLTGWNPASNPFAAGFIRLVQVGADTVMQIDQDGVGTAQGFVDFLRLQNVQVGSLTATNTFGWGPLGQAQQGLMPSDGADTLQGTAGPDSMPGLGGDDYLLGMPGTDTLDGGAGNDTLDGGAGPDSLLGGIGADRLDSGGDSGGGFDTLSGGAGNDTLTGSSASNYLRGDEGDDVIVGLSGFDDANGNMGNDTIATGAGDDWAVGGKDNDLLLGEAGGDVVWGNLGNDTQNGGDGNDQVRGGQGDDTVTGGAGDDFVSGDRGNDTVAGGAGADLIHGSQDAGIDRVVDFNLAEGDRVMLDPGTTYTVSQVGADTVIDMGGGHQMILVGVQFSTLTPGWIFGA